MAGATRPYSPITMRPSGSGSVHKIDLSPMRLHRTRQQAGRPAGQSEPSLWREASAGARLVPKDLPVGADSAWTQPNIKEHAIGHCAAHTGSCSGPWPEWHRSCHCRSSCQAPLLGRSGAGRQPDARHRRGGSAGTVLPSCPAPSVASSLLVVCLTRGVGVKARAREHLEAPLLSKLDCWRRRGRQRSSSCDRQRRAGHQTTQQGSSRCCIHWPDWALAAVTTGGGGGEGEAGGEQVTW